MVAVKGQSLCRKDGQLNLIFKVLERFGGQQFTPAILNATHKKVGTKGTKVPRQIGYLSEFCHHGNTILANKQTLLSFYSRNRPARFGLIDLKSAKDLALMEVLSTSPSSHVFKRQHKLLTDGRSTTAKHLWMLNFSTRKLKRRHLIQMDGVNTVHISHDLHNSKFIVYKPGAKRGKPIYYGDV